MSTSLQRIRDFVALVRVYRGMEAEFRRTQDSRLRSALPKMQLRVDNEAAYLAVSLALDAGETVTEQPVAVEGGVA